MPGWAEEQTPAPFLYICGNLKLWINCRLWGVWEGLLFRKMCIFYKLEELKCNFMTSLDIGLLKRNAENCFPFCENDEDKLHLLLFFQAIASVNSDYLHYYQNVLDSQGRENYKVEEILLERTFAYELYRNWQNQLEMYHINTVRVDAEIGKKITNRAINYEKLKEIEGDYKEPDLVLHAGQGVTDNHTIICEIKRNVQLDNNKISNDIIKICHFIDPRIWNGKPYKFGSFVVVNKDFDELNTQIVKSKEFINKKIREKELTPDLSHILCIAYNGDTVKWDTLNNLWL